MTAVFLTATATTTVLLPGVFTFTCKFQSLLRTSCGAWCETDRCGASPTCGARESFDPSLTKRRSDNHLPRSTHENSNLLEHFLRVSPEGSIRESPHHDFRAIPAIFWGFRRMG